MKKNVSIKKVTAVLLACIMAVSLIACGKAQKADSEVITHIAGLKGPTSMGMVKLMDDAANNQSKGKYDFTLAGSADEVTPKLISGEIDIAALPANLASVLYNNTQGEIELLAVNTLGVLYIVDKGDSIHSVSDLKGKTIVGSGKGSTPEFSLRYILAENGIDPDKDVNIEWKSEHTEVVQTLAADATGQTVGLLPQPFVTAAGTQVEGLHIAVDLTKEWDALDNGSKLITGVMAVRKKFASEHPDALKTFLEEYEASVDYVNANVGEAANLIEKFDIIKAAVAKNALPYCNIVCISGDEMKASVKGYLEILFEAEPKSVGGKMPGEDFYLDF